MQEKASVCVRFGIGSAIPTGNFEMSQLTFVTSISDANHTQLCVKNPKHPAQGPLWKSVNKMVSTPKLLKTEHLST